MTIIGHLPASLVRYLVPTSAADVRATARSSGQVRILVTRDGVVVGVVHVRDTMAAPDSSTAEELMRPVLRLEASTPVYAVLATMRETRNHLAVVETESELAVSTLADVLQRLFPRTLSA